NGRFFEYMIHKLQCHNLAELQELGKKSFEELYKVLPSFIRRAEASHKSHKNFQEFTEGMKGELKSLSQIHASEQSSLASDSGVKLISYDPDAVYKVAGALLHPFTNKSLGQLVDYTRRLTEEELGRILDAAASMRENRRQKSPRALEHASFTF